MLPLFARHFNDQTSDACLVFVPPCCCRYESTSSDDSSSEDSSSSGSDDDDDDDDEEKEKEEQEVNGAKEEHGKVEEGTTGEEYRNEGAVDVQMKTEEEEEGQEKSETRERSVEVTSKAIGTLQWTIRLFFFDFVDTHSGLTFITDGTLSLLRFTRTRIHTNPHKYNYIIHYIMETNSRRELKLNSKAVLHSKCVS